MKILANDGLAADGVTLLENAGFSVSTENIGQEQLIDSINSSNLEILLVRSATKVRKDIIDACPNLKLIGRGGVGMDNIDVEYAREKGIKVINTPAASSQSVAELVFAHLFGLCRNLHKSNRNMPIKGNSEFAELKKKYKGVELRGKTMGIIGFGRIGQSVAKYALGLGMKIRAYDAISMSIDVQLEIHGAGDVTVRINTEDLDSVLTLSDFISLHTPAQADGSPILMASNMSQIKKGAILINASRGGIIDESDLIIALDSGQLNGVALDVFNNEPNPDNRLLVHPKISLTPHIGAATGEAQNRVATELANQIIEAFQPA